MAEVNASTNKVLKEDIKDEHKWNYKWGKMQGFCMNSFYAAAAFCLQRAVHNQSKTRSSRKVSFQDASEKEWSNRRRNTSQQLHQITNRPICSWCAQVLFQNIYRTANKSLIVHRNTQRLQEMLSLRSLPWHPWSTLTQQQAPKNPVLLSSLLFPREFSISFPRSEDGAPP